MVKSPARAEEPSEPGLDGIRRPRTERPVLSLPISVALMRDNSAVLTSPLLPGWSPRVSKPPLLSEAVLRALTLARERGVSSEVGMVPASGRSAVQPVAPGAAPVEREVRVEVPRDLTAKELRAAAEAAGLLKESRVEVVPERLNDAGVVSRAILLPAAARQQIAATLPASDLLPVVAEVVAPSEFWESKVGASIAATMPRPAPVEVRVEVPVEPSLEQIAARLRGADVAGLSEDTLRELAVELVPIGERCAAEASRRERLARVSEQEARAAESRAAAEKARQVAKEAAEKAAAADRAAAAEARTLAGLRLAVARRPGAPAPASTETCNSGHPWADGDWYWKKRKNGNLVRACRACQRRYGQRSRDRAAAAAVAAGKGDTPGE